MSHPSETPFRRVPTCYGESVVRFFRYSNGWLCVTLRDSETGESIARLSVVPEGAPEPSTGRFWAKTWNENAQIVDDCLDSGHFRRVEPLQLWPCGFVAAELWEIVPRGELPQSGDAGEGL